MGGEYSVVVLVDVGQELTRLEQKELRHGCGGDPEPEEHGRGLLCCCEVERAQSGGGGDLRHNPELGHPAFQRCATPFAASEASRQDHHDLEVFQADKTVPDPGACIPRAKFGREHHPLLSCTETSKEGYDSSGARTPEWRDDDKSGVALQCEDDDGPQED